MEYVARICEALSNYTDFPKLNLPALDDFSLPSDVTEAKSKEVCHEIERLAQKVRKHWGMGSGPIENFQHYLESNGIIVTGFHDASSNIDSFSQLVEVMEKRYIS